jgi:flavin-dependent dehydrogenase
MPFQSLTPLQNKNQNMPQKPKVIIIGGGLAGLTSSILLAKANFEVILIERKQYPFHRVCGEYISNEVLPFLKSIGFNPEDYGAAQINRLKVTSTSGNSLNSQLDLGAFGISRYQLDQSLYQIALKEGVKFILNHKVLEVNFIDEQFLLEISGETLQASIVIGAFGKRANIDQKLQRKFFYQRSPYIGVKYHIKTDFPNNLIQLDNFKGGYCGISKIEQDLYCLCYLAQNKYVKKYGSIKAMEENVLYQNQHLKHIFQNSAFVWSQPEVINEISFERKSLIENHILMCGDTAGMIAPLCGNGMAMAIHSGKILANHIIKYCSNGIDKNIRFNLEQQYQIAWNNQFATRLKVGRGIQNLFGNNFLTQMAINGLNLFPTLAQQIVKRTHGKPF